ncbi:MAG TPA: glycosyltransferase family 2 protein [Methylibium sp.]
MSATPPIVTNAPLHPLTPAARVDARPSISAVVPAYNEARNLPSLLDALSTQLAAMSPQWEIVVVDDGSRDETPLVMQQWAQRSGIVYLRLSRNFGKETALSAGIDAAQGDVVCLLDADGQHPPAMLPEMLARWRDGVDMVYTVREDRADEGLIKRWGSHLFYTMMQRMSGVDMPAHAGDFRLMDRRVADALRQLPERNRYLKGLYAWVGFRSEGVPYMPAARLHGESSFSFGRLLRLAIDGLTAFTTLPLRLWSMLGFGLALVSIVYAGWLVIEHFVQGNPVPGFATLAVSLMFFSGVQLISIGVLGEYVGRVFEEVKQRPRYLIATRLGQGLDASSGAATPSAQ